MQKFTRRSKHVVKQHITIEISR